jgi:hypothetical protein
MGAGKSGVAWVSEKGARYNFLFFLHAKIRSWSPDAVSTPSRKSIV